MQGLILINKPKGFTSQDVVSKTKKILNIKKAGHTGTLDPLATGVLPVLLGNYTKLSKYLIDHDKTYKATIKLGEKTETGDLEGKIIATSNVKIEDRVVIEKTLKSFEGKQMQIPPIYSAIKINGKKLYEYARSGEKVEIPSRQIEIYYLKLCSFKEDIQEIEIEVSCSKGTYIRKLCEDIAEKLGSVGFMKELERIKVDNFKIQDAITFEELEAKKDNKYFLQKHIYKMEQIFNNYPSVEISEKQESQLINGVSIKMLDAYQDGIYNIYVGNNYIGLGVMKENRLKRDIIIEK